ncbi:hypothetical protein AVEN_152971-1 [Araneus ventricosus]|uniref:Uncharacterized protein n=1 Tax=Araneus ventricosus TaxID=182803 RepID=A0A4Y2ADC0_ARAVE|nr:hypothetical protein AVEN_152971-1 [Araneus ventricosus]
MFFCCLPDNSPPQLLAVNTMLFGCQLLSVVFHKLIDIIIHIVMFFLPARTFSHEERVEHFSVRPQTAGQSHLVVIKRTFSKVTAAIGERPQYTGINNCQRAHMVGYEENSGVLSCHTCIVLVVMKLRNHPTVGIDHWGHRRLVVGRTAVRLSS